MAISFNTRRAVRKLRDQGVDEATADTIVEVVEEATGELITRDQLRAELYRALAIQGGLIIGAVVALVKLT